MLKEDNYKAKIKLNEKLIILIYTILVIFIRFLHHFIKPHPKTIKLNNRVFTITGNLEYRIYWSKNYEKNIYKILDKFLDLDYSYIDIGAFIGSTSLYSTYLSKKVYALEPDPIAFNELKNNVLLNTDLKDKIELHKKCLNDKSGKVRFGNVAKGGDSTSSLYYGNLENSWIVDGITFDEFVKQNNITDCNFIKMDIEGAEIIVLPSMKKYLEIQKPILYLSMHPRFFKDPINDTKKIMEILSIYKNIYTDNGKKIELDDLLSKKRLRKRYAILAIDTEY